YARRDSPFHHERIPRIDVFIDHRHVLAEKNRVAPDVAHYVAYMAMVSLLDRDVHVEAGATRFRHADILDAHETSAAQMFPNCGGTAHAANGSALVGRTPLIGTMEDRVHTVRNLLDDDIEAVMHLMAHVTGEL